MKHLLAAKLVLLIATGATGAFVIFPETASANFKLDCKSLNGKWSGSMRGVFGGATSMSIKNCRVSWTLPDKRINHCRYKEKAGKIEYSCSLGSRGVVVIKGNKITMKNVYTAHKHGSYVVKVSKVSQ